MWRYLLLASLLLSQTIYADLLFSREQVDGVLSKLGGDNQFDAAKTVDWGVLPGPFYTPELELGIGVALVGLYQADHQSKAAKTSTASLSGFVSSTGAFGLNLKNYTYLDDDRWRIYLTGVLNNVPTDFWGQGYAAGREKQHLGEYKAEQFRLSPLLLRQISKHSYVGLGWDYNDLTAVNADAAFREYLQQQQQDKRSISSGVTAHFSYDTRDFLPNAHQGQALTVSYTYYAPALGSDQRFDRTELQYNYYYPLNEKSTLAFDQYAQFASGDVPWDQLSHLGGNTQMRGYYEGRYQDRYVFATQAEYRHKLDWRHGIALWLGAGTLNDRAGQLFTGHWLPSAGIGYRFEFKPRMNIRLDFGVGKNSSGFYFQVGEAF